MATDLERLLVRIDADSSALRAELGRGALAVQQSSAKIQSSIAGIDKGFAGLRGVLGTLGIGVGAGMLVQMGKQALDAAGGIGELAEQLGVSARALQAYQYGAVQAGIEQGELESGLMRLTRAIGEAIEKEGEQRESFRRLGVAYGDQEGRARSTEAVLRDLADAYQRSGSQSEFAAAAQDLLGRSGQRLLPLLNQGAQGLSDLERAAVDAGVVLSDEMVAGADKAADALERLAFRWEAFKMKVAAGLGTSIADALDRFYEQAQLETLGAQLAENAERQLEIVRQLAAIKFDAVLGPSPGGDHPVFPATADEIARLESQLAALKASAQETQMAIDAVLHPPSAPDAAAPPSAAPPPPPAETAAATKERAAALAELVQRMRDELDVLRQGEADREVYKALLEAQAAAQRDYNAGLRASPQLRGGGDGDADPDALRRILRASAPRLGGREDDRWGTAHAVRTPAGVHRRRQAAPGRDLTDIFRRRMIRPGADNTSASGLAPDSWRFFMSGLPVGGAADTTPARERSPRPRGRYQPPAPAPSAGICRGALM